MITMFMGLTMSLIYGLASLTLVYFVDGQGEVRSFFINYTTSFKTLISLGLIAGTALIVFRSQSVIPSIIESAFTFEQLAMTNYCFYKRRFISARRSITFAAEFFAVGFIVFTLCQFPLN